MYFSCEEQQNECAKHVEYTSDTHSWLMFSDDITFIMIDAGYVAFGTLRTRVGLAPRDKIKFWHWDSAQESHICNPMRFYQCYRHVVRPIR
jgi:hypothetical protein